MHWFSDSSINFRLPPGQGAGLNLAVRVGQYQTFAMLQVVLPPYLPIYI